MELTTQVVGKEVRSVYGGQELIVMIDVEHIVNKVPNSYATEARVRFIDGVDVELDFYRVIEVLNDSNEETLTDEEILRLCNDEKY